MKEHFECTTHQRGTMILRGKKKDEENPYTKFMLNSEGFESRFQSIFANISKEKGNQFAYIDSLYFNLFYNGGREMRQKVLHWIMKKNIYVKKYTLVPIVLWSHWALLILCNYGDGYREDGHPCLLLLDSLHAMGNKNTLEVEIRKFLVAIEICHGRGNGESVIDMPFLYPKVPQQSGQTECGWYVLFYAKLFIENAPESLNFEAGYPYFVNFNWFTLEEFVLFQTAIEAQVQVLEADENINVGNAEVGEHSVVQIQVHETDKNINMRNAEVGEQFYESQIENPAGVVSTKDMDMTKGDKDENFYKREQLRKGKQNIKDKEKVDEENESQDDEENESQDDKEKEGEKADVEDAFFEDSDKEVGGEEDENLRELVGNYLNEFEACFTDFNIQQTYHAIQTEDLQVNQQNVPSSKGKQDAGTTKRRKEKQHKKEEGSSSKKKNKRGGIRCKRFWNKIDPPSFDNRFDEDMFVESNDMLEQDSDDAFHECLEPDNKKEESIYQSLEPDNEKEESIYQRFNKNDINLDLTFHVGMIFSTGDDLKHAILNHGIKYGRQLYYKKNDKYRIRAACRGLECRWEVYAACLKETGSYEIRSFRDMHSCTRALDHKLATSKVLCNRYLDDFKSTLGVHTNDFIQKVHRELNVNINKWKVYRTKKAAMDKINGSYQEQYKMLWDYCEELKRSNPGSTVCMQGKIDDETGGEAFYRIYVALQALKTGFIKGCRKILGLDGTFLKGPHRGVLLTAVSIDANNGMFPVVYAVVDSENKPNWSWFIGMLIKDFLIDVDDDKWTFISDRQKGLVPALAEMLPKSEHRHCARHVHSNLKLLHSGDVIKEQFWRCAKATYENQFNEEMERLKNISEDAFHWLQNNTSPSCWSRAFFRFHTKSDVLLNNYCEVFNKNILLVRSKPILGLLEGVRIYLMLRHQSKRVWGTKQKGALCPNIKTKLDIIIEESCHCSNAYAGGNNFEIRESSGEQFTVDIGLHRCSCRVWELTGIPCRHAVCSLGFLGLKPENYVDGCYSLSAYKRAYAPIVKPINGPNNWPKSKLKPLQPPEIIKLPGRPRKKRKLEIGEKRVKVDKDGRKKLILKGLLQYKCRACGQPGHNKRKCKQPQQVEEKQQQQQQKHTVSPNQLDENLVVALIPNSVASGPSSIPSMNEEMPACEKEKIKKARRCRCCGKTGHNRSTCSDAR